jgi:uncharacterized Zn-finger protein
MGKPKYKVKCAYCGRQFTVPDLATPLPKHTAKAVARGPGIPISCAGSGLPGVLLIKPAPPKGTDDNLT